MNDLLIQIKVIEDAADFVTNPNTQKKLLDILYKIFQDRGIVVSIDVNESTREEDTTSQS
jgi:hypothetical protein